MCVCVQAAHLSVQVAEVVEKLVYTQYIYVYVYVYIYMWVQVAEVVEKLV